MQISSLGSIIIISDNLKEAFSKALKDYKNAHIFITVDENTKKHCLPLLPDIPALKKAKIIETRSGELNKNIETTLGIWKYLSSERANRKSLVINLGGGVLCDMGGFAAATFKRGIDFINIPTTLLAQVDASVGGKLGIDLENYKNEIGLFKTPCFVLIYTKFLQTLDKANLLSGYAEIIKHALINSPNHWKKVKEFDPRQKPMNYKQLESIISKSIFIKNDFVQKDPIEKDLRKALNFGHTIGHAIESFFMNTPNQLLHGQAVAYGMIYEAYLSYKNSNLLKDQLVEIVDYVTGVYGKIKINTTDYKALMELMTHDKKNMDSNLNFTLISDIGTVEINQVCSQEDICEAFEFYKEYPD